MTRKNKKKKTAQLNHARHKSDSSVTYICPSCKRTEKIPAEVVLHFDFMDDGDPAFPPRFSCQFCHDVLMTPLKFVGHKGYTYITDQKTAICISSPPDSQID